MVRMPGRVVLDGITTLRMYASMYSSGAVEGLNRKIDLVTR